MLRRNLLKAFTSIIPVSLMPAIKLQTEVKPFRVVNEEKLNGFWSKTTYDKNDCQLTYENSDGTWSKHTYDESGRILTAENSDGTWSKHTYDESGRTLTAENSDGTWYKLAYDESGKANCEYGTKILI